MNQFNPIIEFQIISVIITSITFIIIGYKFLKKFNHLNGKIAILIKLLISGIIIWILLFSLLTFANAEISYYLTKIAIFSIALSMIAFTLLCEISQHEKPRLLRITIQAFLLGELTISLIRDNFNNSTIYYFDNIENFGLVFTYSFDFILLILLFSIIPIISLIEIIIKTIKISKVRRIHIPMVTSLIIIIIMFTTVILTMVWSIYSPYIKTYIPSIASITVLINIVILYRSIIAEEKIISILLSPHKASAVFIQNMSGVEIYQKIFDSLVLNENTSNLISPMISAINSFLKESMYLANDHWIRIIKNESHTFIIDAVKDRNLVGILIADAYTTILQDSLRSTLLEFSELNNQYHPEKGISVEIRKIQEEIIRKNFSFITF